MLDWLKDTVPALASSTGQFIEGIVAFGVFSAVGYIIDTILFRIINGRSERKHSRIGAAIARGLHGLPTALAVLVGASVGLHRLTLAPRGIRMIETSVNVGLIVVLTIFAARIIGRVVHAYTSREDSELPSSSIFINLARGFVWVLGGLSIMAALGISITPMLTALGVGGLALGLALQSTLENVFSGIQVLMSRQIEPGDFIQLETGEQGWVQDVTWRNTTIKLFSNDLIIVPNSTIAQSRIMNYTSTDEEHVIWLDVGVAYDSDLNHVENVTREVAAEMQKEPGTVNDYVPLFRFTKFGDSSIELTISIRSETVADRWVLRHEFIKRLHARYDSEGITIPFPQRTVHMAEQPQPAE